MRLWRRTRTDYFTQGLTDGRKAAFYSPPTVVVESVQIREQAELAGAALPGRVASDDVRTYRSGWIEGYSTMRERATPNSGAPAV